MLEQIYVVLNCGINAIKVSFTISVFRAFWANAKHDSVTCWRHGPPALYKSHEPTHKWLRCPLTDHQLRSYHQRLSQSKSAQQVASAHFSSNNLTQKKTIPSCHCPWTLMAQDVWRCPIKLLDGTSMSQVVFRQQWYLTLRHAPNVSYLT